MGICDFLNTLSMYSVYNLLLSALLLPLSPYMAMRWMLDREEWRTRLGHLPKSNYQGAFWFHGSSVGEIGALASLLSEVRAAFPKTPLVVSAMTKTGRERAMRDLKEADLFILSPLDFPPFVRRAVRVLKPRALLVAETELWPNLLREARRAGAKLAMVNGRVSDKSFPIYRRFGRFFRMVLSNFQLLCVQSEEDRARFLELGVQPDRVLVTGSLKFDSSPRQPPMSSADLGIPRRAPIFVAGSTRPGEEEILFHAFRQVEQSFPDLRLIVAPRHLLRMREVEKLASSFGLSVRRRSERATFGPEQVLLLDSLGELSRVYAVGQVSFVGGTLLPYGGHNLLEPAFHKLPVIFGPHTESMRGVASRLLETGGGVQVKDYRDLADAVLGLLRHARERKRRGEAAFQVAREMAGGTKRTLAVLTSYGVL